MGLFKKICREICRPFRQVSRATGRIAKHIGGKHFGAFIERALCTITDMIATTGAGLFGGPLGVAAATAILSGEKKLSDKDIFKASILGGASAFISVLNNELILAKGLGISTIATTSITNASLSAMSGDNVLKGVVYGFGGLIAPNNPLLVASMKTIAEKDIEKGLLHIVGFEAGQYLQAYVNTTEHIEKQIKQEDKEIFGPNRKNNTVKKINSSIKKDAELYNFVKNELIEPFKESIKSNHVNKRTEIRKKFDEIYEGVNDKMWKLKTRIAAKTNEINSQLVFKIHPESGLQLTADIDKTMSIGMGTDNYSVGAGLSKIYPRGFVVKYTVHKKTENNLPIDISEKFSEKTNKGYCYTTKTYATVGTDATKLTTELHMNADCAIIAAAGATVAVLAPQTIPAIGISLMIPAVASAQNSPPNTTNIDTTKLIDVTATCYGKKISYKINSGKYQKLSDRVSQCLHDDSMVNRVPLK